MLLLCLVLRVIVYAVVTVIALYYLGLALFYKLEETKLELKWRLEHKK